MFPCSPCAFILVAGVELALRHMRIGQQCLVRCESRFAYGSDGCPATRKEDVELPPNSDIEVWIELLGVQSTKTVSDMNLEETIAEGDRKKMVGNGHFERKAYKKALRAYTSAANTVAGLDFPNEDADAFREARQLRIDCGNNMATTCVRLGDLEKAKEAAVGVLELDPVNAKALFRAGQVSSLQSNFAEASLALQKARALNPDSKEIRAELQRLSTRRKAYEKKRQAMQESMARSLVPGSSRAEPPRDVSSSVAGAARPANAEKEPVCPVDDKAKPLVRDRFRGVLYPLLLVLVAWGVSYLLPRTAQRV